jgi:hypothetical protein
VPDTSEFERAAGLQRVHFRPDLRMRQSWQQECEVNNSCVCKRISRFTWVLSSRQEERALDFSSGVLM